MTEGAHRFYTGHSPRNFMTSVAAAIGHSKDDRDYLGRWLVNRATGSAEYTRTSREVVRRLQKSVCRSLLEGGSQPYVEEEALAALKSYVDGQGASGALIRRRHDLMRQANGEWRLGLKWPAFKPKAIGVNVEGDPGSEDEPFEGETKYFITTTKQGHRRLHLNGPCHVKAHKCASVTFTNRLCLEAVDSICRDCKHRMRLEAGQEQPKDSSSESTSSCSS